MFCFLALTVLLLCGTTTGQLIPKCPEVDVSESANKVLEISKTAAGEIPVVGETLEKLLELLDVLLPSGEEGLIDKLIAYTNCMIADASMKDKISRLRENIKNQKHTLKQINDEETPSNLNVYFQALLNAFNEFPYDDFVDSSQNVANIQFLDHATSIHLSMGLEMIKTCAKLEMDCSKYVEVFNNDYQRYVEHGNDAMPKVQAYRLSFIKNESHQHDYKQGCAGRYCWASWKIEVCNCFEVFFI